MSEDDKVLRGVRLNDKSRYWQKVHPPVLEFLSKPRSWADLNAFTLKNGTSRDEMVNILAWLENRRLATTTVLNGKTYWIQRPLLASAVLNEVVDSEVPKPRRKKKAG